MKTGAKILVIDDEIQMRRLIQRILQKEGYTVCLAADGKEGLQKLLDIRPDLILLDIGLPDQSGSAILQTIRAAHTLPIIVLTVQDTQSDKVLLLEAGADDYITKPFGIPELLARIKVAFRHHYAQDTASVFQYKTLTLQPLSRLVSIAGVPIKLTATEYDIFKSLVRHPGKLVTQQQLLREIWGKQSLTFTHYLRTYIGQLRKKIECFPELKGFIITEPSIGYRLNIL